MNNQGAGELWVGGSVLAEDGTEGLSPGAVEEKID